MPRWLLYCLLAVALWGAWGVIPKNLGALSASQQQAFSTVGILPVLAFLLSSRHIRGGGWKLHGALIAFVAGVASSLGNLAYYAALGEGGSKASVLAPLTSLYPLVVVALATAFLGERPSRLQLAGIALALASIYLFVMKPGESMSLAGGAPALAAIALYGVAGTLQKVAADRLSGALATVWFLAAFIPLGGYLIATRPMEWQLPLEAWGWLFLLGITFGLGNLLYLAACAAGAKASVVAPLTGLYPAVVVPLAVYFFQESISRREWAAIALALLAVVGLSQERKR
jgi:drug/metabolite transporter (DMT)-like permease